MLWTRSNGTLPSSQSSPQPWPPVGSTVGSTVGPGPILSPPKNDRSCLFNLSSPLSLLPQGFQLKQIHTLMDAYLLPDLLRDRLEDLPRQWESPCPRPWQPLDWSLINRGQLVGMTPDVFLAIVAGAIATEAPIRGYTQTSRQYLEPLHPPHARFVGGTVMVDGTMVEPGLWEKEERQHTPALLRIYQQLSGEKLRFQPHRVKPYCPTEDSREALYRHGLHRVMTEYGATCLYLWLMAHTTGELQRVLAELVQDEINHTVKFWGFGVWMFPQAGSLFLQPSLWRTLLFPQLKTTDSTNPPTATSDLLRTFHRMMGVLHWEAWTGLHRATFLYTVIRVMARLLQWHRTLTPTYLHQVLGTPPSSLRPSR